MRGNVISYFEMCQREGTSLQRGMNFRLRGRHSVILMSLHPNAPYQDRVEEDGSVLIYEGHDEPRTENTKYPKSVDQPEYLPSGNLAENGSSIRQLKLARQAQRTRILFGYTRKLRKAFGLITATSILWIPGGNQMALAKSSNSSWLLLRA
jgi:hypothetical protein